MKTRRINYLLANTIGSFVVFFLGIIFRFWAIPKYIKKSSSALPVLQPDSFPNLMATLLIILGAVLTVINYSSLKRQESSESRNTKTINFSIRSLIIVVVGVIYVILLEPIGYPLMNTLSILFLYKLFGGEKWWKGLLLGSGLTLGLWLFFAIYLQLMIPAGLLGGF
jgi:hypothetical protein